MNKSAELAASGQLHLDLAQMRPEGFLASMRGYEEQLINKVSAGAGWVSNVGCLVCASPEREPLWPAHGIMLLRCLRCGHAYFERMPRDLGEVYQGESYLQLSKSAALSNVDYRVQRFGAERLALIRQFQPFRPGQTLLDIGCGTGWFLQVAKQADYQVFGFEFSAALARFTAASVGCTVFESDLAEIPSQFDVITLFDVIEHVPHPAQTFARVRSLLKHDGIALVFCPNFDSLAIRATGAASNLVMPTRHLSYFSRSSVHKLCELSGMKLLWFRTAGLDVGDLMSWFESRGMQRNLAQWQQFSDTLQPALDQLGVGNHLRFMATPLAA